MSPFDCAQDRLREPNDRKANDPPKKQTALPVEPEGHLGSAWVGVLLVGEVVLEEREHRLGCRVCLGQHRRAGLLQDL
jgi:hypothetical protein